MNNTSKITQENIKKITSLSNSEIEKKLKGILADSKNGAVKKMLSDVNVESLKKKLQSSSKDEIDGFMGILSKIDPNIIKKIKDSLG